MYSGMACQRDALANTIEYVTSSLDSHNNSAIMSIELKKAFDTLDDKILIPKLYLYGI